MSFSFPTFWDKNKVLILGAIVAALAVIQQYFSAAHSANTLVVILAIGSVLAAYFAKNLTGQWTSIFTIVGGLITTISTEYAAGHVSWAQIAITALVSLIGVFTNVGSSPTTGKLAVMLAKKRAA